MPFLRDGLVGLLITIPCGFKIAMCLPKMADYYQNFPFEEIRRRDGNYFDTAEDAIAAGYKESQVWSVIESEGTYTYGPSFHYINRLGYIATKEHHDGKTYYHDVTEEEDEETDCFECYGAGCERCRGETHADGE